MTDSNKETLVQFGKGLSIFLLSMMAIITSAGVWNGVAKDAIDSFYGWVAGLNFIAEGLGIYKLVKYLFPNPKK